MKEDPRLELNREDEEPDGEYQIEQERIAWNLKREKELEESARKREAEYKLKIEYFENHGVMPPLTERERREADEAWERMEEEMESGMWDTRILKEKIVKSRKVHRCSLCNQEIPAGTKCHSLTLVCEMTGVDGVYHHIHCKAIEDEEKRKEKCGEPYLDHNDLIRIFWKPTDKQHAHMQEAFKSGRKLGLFSRLLELFPHATVIER